jgi:hypothetical protein
VSAKFHVIGDDSKWLRIRLQEEIYAHGVEGSILSAGEKTLAVVADGDKARIKRLYTDVREFLPETMESTELAFSLGKPTRHLRMRAPTGRLDSEGFDIMFQYLREIEKAVTRIDQKVNSVLAYLEGEAGAQVFKPRRGGGDAFEEKDIDVEDDAVGGFAAMFGD